MDERVGATFVQNVHQDRVRIVVPADPGGVSCEA